MDHIQKALLEYLRYDAPISGAIDPPLSPEDWAFLSAEAQRHGVGPLLCYKLQRRVPPPEIPAPVLSELQKAYFINAVANRRRFQYLGDALRALTAAGVPVVVLKGAYLAEAVYPNIALRTMGDVDLLVKREDLPKAVAALKSAGFIPKEHHLEAPDDANEFHFVDKVSRATIELHWQLFKPKYSVSLQTDSIWSRATTARIAGVDVLALSSEDLLVHLSVHAAIHAFVMGLKALCDIAVICAKLPVDWGKLTERTDAEGANRPVWLLLALSRRLLGAAIPDTALTSLATGLDDEKYFFAAQSTLFLRSSPRTRTKAMRPGEMLFFGRKRIADKTHLVLEQFFPSRRRLAGDFHCRPNSILIYLYYPLWMAKCLQRAVPVLWAELTGRLKSGLTAVSRKETAELMNWVIPISSPSAASSSQGQRKSARL